MPATADVSKRERRHHALGRTAIPGRIIYHALLVRAPLVFELRRAGPASDPHAEPEREVIRSLGHYWEMMESGACGREWAAGRAPMGLRDGGGTVAGRIPPFARHGVTMRQAGESWRAQMGSGRVGESRAPRDLARRRLCWANELA